MQSIHDMQSTNASTRTKFPFSVKKCEHGHLHLHFRGITLTLTQTEFEQLAKTVTTAYLRYGVEEAISNQTTH